jgi:hypothetical protein
VVVEQIDFLGPPSQQQPANGQASQPAGRGGKAAA